MQQNLGFLFAAFALTWVAIFGYLFLVQRQLVDTGRRLRVLESEQSSGELPGRSSEPGGG